jgi:hypothetical protein
MHGNAIEEDEAAHGHGARFWMYWISSVVATLIFLLFMATMMLVPGVLPGAKLQMLSIAGIALAISLGIGVWRPIATDAPLAGQPLGPAMGVILLVELAICIMSVFKILIKG